MGFTANSRRPLQKSFRFPGGVLAFALHGCSVAVVAVAVAVAVAGMYCNFLPLIEQPDHLTRDPCFQL